MSDNPSDDRRIISLYELCNGLKKYIDRRLRDKRLLVVAEINNLKIHTAGHMYMDLVEMQDGRTVAKIQASLWNNRFAVLEEKLGADIHRILENGNKVLFEVTVVFHEVYGLKIEILDVDINYTLGELEKKRQLTIEKLKKEHLLEENKKKYLPPVVQRFILIASEGSSGYKDFINQITNNSSSFSFDFVLLNTLVQGERAEEEIIRRLNQAAMIDEIDAVLILRGGGSKLDLEVFNSFRLCYTIANHSKPVLTGIGHETDICVADLVAHTYLKTPTALAEFLHDRAKTFEQKVKDFTHEICRKVTGTIHKQSQRLLELHKDLKVSSSSEFEKQKDVFIRAEKSVRNSKKEVLRRIDSLHYITRSISEKISKSQSEQRINLHRMESAIKSSASLVLQGNHNQISAISKLIYNLHPQRLIERGYATVSLNGKIMKKGAEIKIGDSITVNVYDKELICEVVKINDQWTLNLMSKLLKSLNK